MLFFVGNRCKRKRCARRSIGNPQQLSGTQKRNTEQEVPVMSTITKLVGLGAILTPPNVAAIAGVAGKKEKPCRSSR